MASTTEQHEMKILTFNVKRLTFINELLRKTMAQLIYKSVRS